MNRVSIIGLGLMGGSLGLAMKARGFKGRIAGYARRSATQKAALEMGAVDTVFGDPHEAVHDADLVIYCTPILTIPDLIRSSLPGMKPGAILTDVGSTKAELDRDIGALLRGTSARFVGSHPVAGSERQGIEAARADLYKGALVVVTPSETAPDEEAAAEVVVDFWQSLGALVTVISAREHDALMARTSHVPHLMASLLAWTVGRDGDQTLIGRFCGTGFRDTTRVAEGSPEVWHDIVRTNAAAIATELESCRDTLNHLIKCLDDNHYEAVKEWLTQGRERRRGLINHSPMD